MTTPGPQFDMDQVASQTAQQLGATHGLLTLELAAQRAVTAGLQHELDEKKKKLEEMAAELERARQTNARLQQQISAPEATGDDDPAPDGQP